MMNPPAPKHFHQFHADEVLRLLEVNWFLQEAKAEKAIESLAHMVATCLSLTEIV